MVFNRKVTVCEYTCIYVHRCMNTYMSRGHLTLLGKDPTCFPGFAPFFSDLLVKPGCQTLALTRFILFYHDASTAKKGYKEMGTNPKLMETFLWKENSEQVSSLVDGGHEITSQGLPFTRGWFLARTTLLNSSYLLLPAGRWEE